MKLAIMQPYLCPYIGYWQLMSTVDTFVIYDDVNFIKRGYINRNSILVNGQAHRFTLELKKASQNRLINDINIGVNNNKLLKMLYITYKKAEYFDTVYPVLEDIFTRQEQPLSKFVGYSLMQIANYLKIATKFIYSSDINKDNRLKGQDKIIDIAKKLHADIYINAIGGQMLYDKTKFHQAGIELKFIKTELIPYRQFNDNFVPNLSIIDVMMFNSVETIAEMLNKYYLI